MISCARLNADVRTYTYGKLLTSTIYTYSWLEDRHLHLREISDLYP